MNGYRSAISAFHEYVEGKPVGKHPQVCALLSGVFNERPPQPRYVFIWDVQVVLNFIKSNWPVSSNLSDKNLTLKLTTLLALTSSSRASAIHHLNINFMITTEKFVQFTFHKLHKSWRRGKAPPNLTYYAFPADPELCFKNSSRISQPY